MLDAVSAIRVILCSLILASFFTPSLLQPVVDGLWRYLLSSPLYKASTFETLWTILSYAIIEPYITHVYMTQPERRLVVQDLHAKDPNAPVPRRPRGMKRPARRAWEGVVYVAPLLAMDLTMIKKFAGVPVEHIVASGGYSMSAAFDHCVIDSGTDDQSMSCKNTRAYAPIPSTFLIPSLHNMTFSSPLQTTRALPPVAPSAAKVLTDLTLAFLIYDFLFFALHLALHLLPLPFLSRSHAPHHAHAQMQPQITNALSVPERLSLVLLANFSLNAVRAHVLSRTLFVPMFVWMLVELHSGLELKVGFEKVLPAGWAVGARKHAEHHATGRGGYEPFFGWWDAAWEALVKWRRRRKAATYRAKTVRQEAGADKDGIRSPAVERKEHIKGPALLK